MSCKYSERFMLQKIMTRPNFVYGTKLEIMDITPHEEKNLCFINQGNLVLTNFNYR